MAASSVQQTQAQLRKVLAALLQSRPVQKIRAIHRCKDEQRE